MTTPNDTLNDATTDAQPFGIKDFAALGMGEIAYVKPVSLQGQTLYAVYSANGQALAVLDSEEQARVSIRNNDMLPVTVH